MTKLRDGMDVPDDTAVCPWCLRRPRFRRSWDQEIPDGWWVGCMTDGCRGRPETAAYSEKHQALNAWNLYRNNLEKLYEGIFHVSRQVVKHETFVSGADVVKEVTVVREVREVRVARQDPDGVRLVPPERGVSVPEDAADRTGSEEDPDRGGGAGQD